MSDDTDFSNAFALPGGGDKPKPEEEQPKATQPPEQQPPAAPLVQQGSTPEGTQPAGGTAQKPAAPTQPADQPAFESLSLGTPGETLQTDPSAGPQKLALGEMGAPKQPTQPSSPPAADRPSLAPKAPQATNPEAQNQPAASPPPPAGQSAPPAPPPQEGPPQGQAAPPAEGDKPKKPMRIGEKLISLGLISDDQLQIALQEQKRSKKLLGGILVEMGFLTESALTEVLAEAAGTQRFDPKVAVLDTALIRAIPKEVAIRQKVLAVELKDNVLKLAMADVYNVLAIDQVRRYFPKNAKIVPVYCTETEILELVDQYYDYEMSIDGILEEIETGIREQNVVLEGETDGYINPTVRLVNAILVDAIKGGASDIHFEPEGSFLRLRYRIDGNMMQVRSFHKDYWSAIAVRIKIMSGMNIAETRNPQDGRITYTVMGREVDFRVATHPTVHGENIVMRLLDKAKALVELDQLGFSPHNIRLLKTLLKRPEGIIIVTGPTGSGKTTTLYSILSFINSMEKNIMTLEDPVEYQLPLIRQTNVKEGSTDFVNGIKSLMRQDPDIIFVGEVRDEETALMAVRAALTGHQVFTTLHTNDALGAIPRLMDIGVPSHLLAGTLICTLAQRLARRLCNHCKKPRQATAEEAQILGFEPDEAPTVYDPVGCDKCSKTGYKGRIAINEILRVDPEMDELIARNETRNAIMEHAQEMGYVTMQDDGVDKVVKGEIDLKELIGRIDMTGRL